MYDYFSLRMPMYFDEDAGGSGGTTEGTEVVVDKGTEDAIGDMLEFAVGKEDLPEVKVGEDGKPLVVGRIEPVKGTEVGAETHEEVDPADLIEKVDLKKVEEKLKEKKPESEKKEEQVAEKPAEKKEEVKEEKVEDGKEEVVTLTEELIKSLGLDETYKVGEEVILEAEEEPKTELPAPVVQNEGLLKEIERLSGILQLNNIQAGPKVKQEGKKDEKTEEQAQTEVGDLTPVDFKIVTDETLNNTVGTAEGMNQFGEEIAGKVAQAILPLMVVNMRNLIPKYVELQSGVERFFDDNKDLAGVRQYTAQVMNQVRAEQPEVTDVQELLKISATKVRATLKEALAEQKEVEETTLRTVKKKKSAQPGQKKVQRRKVVKEPEMKGKATEQNEQMDEILDFALQQ